MPETRATRVGVADVEPEREGVMVGLVFVARGVREGVTEIVGMAPEGGRVVYMMIGKEVAVDFEEVPRTMMGSVASPAEVGLPAKEEVFVCVGLFDPDPEEEPCCAVTASPLEPVEPSSGGFSKPDSSVGSSAVEIPGSVPIN